ncbi:hypothetical protein WKK05_01315 [Nostoc sp. UHCC 0302]|uniref:hypothetical protein n=1 Tax=Nostoc sp. UHCC 0302 TaxID=3134896 RepID=UPI00311CD6DF
MVSGDAEAIAILQNQLSSKGVELKLLHTSHAFHSLIMQPILQESVKAVSQVQL